MYIQIHSVAICVDLSHMMDSFFESVLINTGKKKF